MITHTQPLFQTEVLELYAQQAKTYCIPPRYQVLNNPVRIIVLVEAHILYQELMRYTSHRLRSDPFHVFSLSL